MIWNIFKTFKKEDLTEYDQLKEIEYFEKKLQETLMDLEKIENELNKLRDKNFV